MWKALENLLLTDPYKLKQQRRRGSTWHDSLKLARAWRFEHPAMWERYMGGQRQVLRGPPSCLASRDLPRLT